MKLKNTLTQIAAIPLILLIAVFTLGMFGITFNGLWQIIATGKIGEQVSFDEGQEVRIGSYSVKFLAKSFAVKIKDDDFVLVPIMLANLKNDTSRFCYSRGGTRISNNDESSGISYLHRDMWETLNGTAYDFRAYNVYHKTGRQCVTILGREPWFLFFEVGKKFDVNGPTRMKFRSENLGNYYELELGAARDCRFRDIKKCVFEL